MVMDYGMSRLGRVNYRESPAGLFFDGGSEIPRQRLHSERTAREIDEEVKRIIEESLQKVRHILETRNKALLALASRLIDKEVIDTDELKEVIEANSPSPVIVPGTASSTKRPGPAKREAGEGGATGKEAGGG
jgi:cell division protease FtsH